MVTQSLSHLDALISEKSLLKHPFYVKWTKGELTMDDMKIYAKEYYHLAKNVPEIVTCVLERIPAHLDTLRHSMEKNLQEEREHVALWERFALSMGITIDELRAYEPSETVRKAAADLVALAEESFEAGVAGMYAFEAELPKIAQTKKEGLIAFYNLTSADAHVYFDEHLNEEEHLKVWREIPMSEAIARSAAEASLSAQNRVLDGVCEKCGITMSC